MTRSSAQNMKSLSPRLDTSVAHSARVWNYLLGGKDNFAADRDVGDMVLQMFPDAAVIARLQRRFLVRTIRFLAGEVGIRQFLDIGTGLPTADNTHEVAQETAPRSKVVYVDNDPLVLRHAQALLTSAPGGVTSYIEADVRDPEQILQEAARTLDFGEPVAVMMLGILGQIPDCECACEDPGTIVAKLLEALPPGSYLALCDGTDTNAELAKAVATYNEYAAYPYHLRSPARIASFFEGLTLVPPGLVTTSRWRPYVTDATGEPREVDALCGVGRKSLQGPRGLVASRRVCVSMVKLPSCRSSTPISAWAAAVRRASDNHTSCQLLQWYSQAALCPPGRTPSKPRRVWSGRVRPEPVDEVLPTPVKLPLGQRQDVDDVGPPGERLRRLRQDRIPRGSGEHVAPRPGVRVELGLDRVQDLRDMLELVDENRPGTGDDEAGVAGRRRSRVRAVKVEDGPVELGRERSEQGALAHGARPGEDHDGLFAHALKDDFGESARTQPANSRHALQDAMRGNS